MSAVDFLPRVFFKRDPVTCARELVGCELFWGEGAGIIVETEAYAALGDEASHTFTRRPSTRMFMDTHQAGAAYVYLNYGIHWMLNVLVKGGSADGFVLVRALEPTRGFEAMTARRLAKYPKPETRNPRPNWLCSGPGKLAQALAIDSRDHGRDLCAGVTVGFRAAPRQVEVVADLRIGISKAVDFPWRFLLRGSPALSVPPLLTKGSPRRREKTISSRA